MEPFKNHFSASLVECIAYHLSIHLGEFDAQAFVDEIVPQLSQLELKQRSQCIADALHRVLPAQPSKRNKVLFAMLHPEKSDQLSKNDRSCVLKIDSPHGSVLLTGDIEKQAEQLLISRHSRHLSADVLLAPHHGSKTSSSNEFIEYVSPKYALISAGYRNRFGLPNQDILLRYEQRGIQTLTTFQSGAISMQFRQAGSRIQKARTEQRRFWHNTVTNNYNF